MDEYSEFINKCNDIICALDQYDLSIYDEDNESLSILTVEATVINCNGFIKMTKSSIRDGMRSIESGEDIRSLETYNIRDCKEYLILFAKRMEIFKSILDAIKDKSSRMKECETGLDECIKETNNTFRDIWNFEKISSTYMLERLLHGNSEIKASEKTVFMQVNEYNNKDLKQTIIEDDVNFVISIIYKLYNYKTNYAKYAGVVSTAKVAIKDPKRDKKFTCDLMLGIFESLTRSINFLEQRKGRLRRLGTMIDTNSILRVPTLLDMQVQEYIDKARSLKETYEDLLAKVSH